MKPKVFVTRRIPDKGLNILADKVDLEIWEEEVGPDKDILIDKVREVNGLLSLLGDPIDKEVLNAGKKLKVVSNYAVGYDNIDISYATEEGIYVTNTPGALTDATADLAFALLLSTARRVVEGDKYTRDGNWQSWGPKLLLGQSVAGASLGIIGLGRIGKAVARRATGFDMDLYYYSRSAKPEVEEELEITKLDLKELLTTCDFISLHCPLTSETEGLIGREELELMKEEAILINTARGSIVDQKVLTEALENNWIAGAGLDVFVEEPIADNDPLLELDNAVVTPHIGSASIKARERMAEMAAEGLLAVLEGREPENLVNEEVL